MCVLCRVCFNGFLHIFHLDAGFQRMQTRLGELARSRLHHRRLGILQQQLVQREPLAQLDGLQPFFIA